MSAVTVEKLAKIIGSEGETLLSQMKEAGLSHTDVKDEVTDKDKKTCLLYTSPSPRDQRGSRIAWYA